MELQDQLTIATPEGVGLTVVLADVGSRGVAYAIDITIQFLFDLALFLGLGIAGAPSGLVLAIFVVAVFMMLFGYFTLFEAFDGGRTPGKRLIGLRVLSADARPMTFWRSLVRNLLRLIDALSAVYLVGITSVLATKKNQRLGDLAADTIVVRVPRGRGRQDVPDVGGNASPAAWAAAAAAVPAAVPPEVATWDLSRVTADDVNAVRTFLNRRDTLRPDIRQQLALDFANRLRPRVVGPPDTEGPERFLEWVVYAKQSRA